MANVSAIPVVDFSAYSLDRSTPDTDRFDDLISSVRDALTSVGFLYLSNHGIPQEEIDRAFSVSKEFFSLSKDLKTKYARADGASHNHGYIERERVQRNMKRPADFTESYDFNSACHTLALEVPGEEEVPEFKETSSTLYEKFRQLSNRLLEVIGRGLNLEDPFLFVKAHKEVGSPGNETILRYAYYPPPREREEVKADQVWFGEHTDFGSVTLLCQDNQGGLEFKTKTGEFIPATPIEGTVVVNLGDLLQKWTADKLISNVHRVVMPDTDEARSSYRQSIIYFYNPDNSYVIKCLDDSDKYPPIISGDFLQERFKATYKF